MKTQELIDALRKHSHNFVTTKKYCVQVYSGGKRGNIKRLDETVVCVFDIEEGRIMIAPAKDNFPYSFGYTRYEIKANEDLVNNPKNLIMTVQKAENMYKLKDAKITIDGENITIGKTDASDEEIIDACKKARIHDFIMTLPDKYNTYIGERGVKLSGGQKQRVSIARIFLKNPPIMILDEATSALDNVTENEIQKSLEELGKNRTNLVVAHRLSTIKNADEIIVLTENGIEERGTHQELVEKNGIYSKLNKK